MHRDACAYVPCYQIEKQLQLSWCDTFYIATIPAVATGVAGGAGDVGAAGGTIDVDAAGCAIVNGVAGCTVLSDEEVLSLTMLQDFT